MQCGHDQTELTDLQEKQLNYNNMLYLYTLYNEHNILIQKWLKNFDIWSWIRARKYKRPVSVRSDWVLTGQIFGFPDMSGHLRFEWTFHFELFGRHDSCLRKASFMFANWGHYRKSEHSSNLPGQKQIMCEELHAWPDNVNGSCPLVIASTGSPSSTVCVDLCIVNTGIMVKL